MKYIIEGICNAFRDFAYFLFPPGQMPKILSDEEAREHDKRMIQSDWEKVLGKRQDWE